ncbi:MAG: helix-turn-helix transcriptional regulator [Deltaproteobacteria bacterium]|nr:helix-turn-helix transcriptional regulator [Deltaproteobacteria bacterium]
MSLFHDFKVRVRKREIVDYIVPERLVDARQARGLTLEEAAEQLGIDLGTLCMYENGHWEIPKEILFKLMSVYKFPAGYFYVAIWERV